MVDSYIIASFIFLHLALVILRMGWLRRYGPTSILFIALFEAFFALPVYIDVLFDRPQYQTLPGLAATIQNVPVLLAFCATVLISDIVLTVGLLPGRTVRPIAPTLPAVWTVPLGLFAYAPLVYLIVTGSFAVLPRYGEVIFNRFAYSADFVSTLTSLISVSFLAVGIAAFTTGPYTQRMRDWRKLIIMAPACILDIWLLGKRSIIAFMLLMLAMRLMSNSDGASRKRNLSILAGVFVLTLFVSQVYVSTFRAESTDDPVVSYENFRVDMGRDHDLKLALSREVEPTLPPILGYRGQSLLFMGGFAVPRSLWQEKPRPYAVYVTAAALGIAPRELGWGLTTSIFSEFVANFGLLGIPIFLGLFIWILRRIEQSDDLLLRYFGTLSLCGLLAVQFVALSIWHLAFIGYAIYSALRSSRHHVPQSK